MAIDTLSEAPATIARGTARAAEAPMPEQFYEDAERVHATAVSLLREFGIAQPNTSGSGDIVRQHSWIGPDGRGRTLLQRGAAERGSVRWFGYTEMLMSMGEGRQANFVVAPRNFYLQYSQDRASGFRYERMLALGDELAEHASAQRRATLLGCLRTLYEHDGVQPRNEYDYVQRRHVKFAPYEAMFFDTSAEATGRTTVPDFFVVREHGPRQHNVRSFELNVDGVMNLLGGDRTTVDLELHTGAMIAAAERRMLRLIADEELSLDKRATLALALIRSRDGRSRSRADASYTSPIAVASGEWTTIVGIGDSEGDKVITVQAAVAGAHVATGSVTIGRWGDRSIRTDSERRDRTSDAVVRTIAGQTLAEATSLIIGNVPEPRSTEPVMSFAARAIAAERRRKAAQAT